MHQVGRAAGLMHTKCATASCVPASKGVLQTRIVSASEPLVCESGAEGMDDGA